MTRTSVFGEGTPSTSDHDESDEAYRSPWSRRGLTDSEPNECTFALGNITRGGLSLQLPMNSCVYTLANRRTFDVPLSAEHGTPFQGEGRDGRGPRRWFQRGVVPREKKESFRNRRTRGIPPSSCLSVCVSVRLPTSLLHVGTDVPPRTDGPTPTNLLAGPRPTLPVWGGVYRSGG